MIRDRHVSIHTLDAQIAKRETSIKFDLARIRFNRRRRIAASHARTAARQPRTFGMRAFVLASFSTISFFVGFSWATFSNVPDVAGTLFPSLTDTSALAWLLNTNNLVQMSTAPAALSLLAWPPAGSTGLRPTVLLAATALFVQSGLWALVTLYPSESWSITALYLGAAAGGCASAFAQGCVSQLSAVWFAPGARSFATAVAYTSVYAGMSLAFLMAFILGSPGDLQVTLRVEAAIAALLLVLAWLAFPDAPSPKRSPRTMPSIPSIPSVPSIGSGSARMSTTQERLLDPGTPPGSGSPKSWGMSCTSELERVLEERASGQLPSCVLIGVSAAWINGFFSSWSTNLPTMWDLGSDSPVPSGAILGFAAAVAYPIGGALAGVVADRYFPRRLLKLLQLCLLVAMLAFVPVVALQPPPPWTTATEPESETPPSLAVYVPCVVIGGAALGATMPISLELLAEIGYPLPPGVSANMVVPFVQIMSTMNTALVPVLSPPAMSVVMLISVFACTVLLLPVHEVYRRSDPERSGLRDVEPIIAEQWMPRDSEPIIAEQWMGNSM